MTRAAPESVARDEADDPPPTNVVARDVRWTPLVKPYSSLLLFISFSSLAIGMASGCGGDEAATPGEDEVRAASYASPDLECNNPLLGLARGEAGPEGAVAQARRTAPLPRS